MNDQIREAIDPHPKGVLIRFEVAPGSTRLLVPSSYNPWRKSIEAKLTERPTKGKANLQLERAIADLFEISAERVSVTAGQKSSRRRSWFWGSMPTRPRSCWQVRYGSSLIS